ncbi:MAG: hypothetical protein K2M95_04275 [Clostridiales bacterium]|nr:hypothetical protein [Clostridiales bacterium]
MTKWWNELHALQQVMFVIACAATLFMIVQVILLAIGSGDSDSTFEADTNIDDVDSINDDGVGLTVFGLRVLSVRSVIAFLAVGCWVTFTLFYSISYYALIPGVIAGVAAAFAIAAFIKAMEKLQGSGNIKTENAVGKTAEVYIPIPALRAGSGKVNVYVQERYTELEAVCDSAEQIKTGEKVKIVDVLTEGTVVVEPITAPVKSASESAEAAETQEEKETEKE